MLRASSSLMAAALARMAYRELPQAVVHNRIVVPNTVYLVFKSSTRDCMRPSRTDYRRNARYQRAKTHVNPTANAAGVNRQPRPLAESNRHELGWRSL